jgi:glycosyltransferase involved in cell wall biosynthesis
LYGGQGDCDEELQRLAKKHSNLKLHGIVTLKEIHRIERNSDVLVNPRPNEKEFTKYSFPSKTAEYLMMNVPVVMHKLDGVPDVYDPYLYYIENNTPQSIAETICQVLSVDSVKRSALAQKGREFVVQNKNHDQQARRVIEFIDSIISEGSFCKV